MWKFCLGQEDFVKGELAHIREIVSTYELDGLWIDGDGPSTCYCDECVRQLRENGLDPLDAGVQHDHKVALNYSFLKRIRDVVKEARPSCLMCPQNQGSTAWPSARHWLITPTTRPSSQTQSIMGIIISPP